MRPREEWFSDVHHLLRLFFLVDMLVHCSMVSKHFHFKKVLKSAHETLLCAVVLKARLSRMEKC